MRPSTNREHTLKSNRTRARALTTLLLATPLLFIFLNCQAGPSAATNHDNDNAPAATTSATNAPNVTNVTNTTKAGDAATRDDAATAGDPSSDAETSSQEAGPSSTRFEGTTAPVEKKREGVAPAVLRSVRTARHDAFDRVVFEFDGASAPGYRVEYSRRTVRRCGSGRAVSVLGRARLLVRLRPAQAHTDEGRPTVNERERRPRLAALREMKLICDFEADVEWVFGLASAKPFRVLELTNPTRLVVDIRR